MDYVDDRLIIAIDTPSITRANLIINATRNFCHNYKFGLTFFTNNSMSDLDIINRKFNIHAMIDKKFHDIPRQVADAVTELAHLKFVRYATLHISGGAAMLAAAIKAVDDVHIIGRTPLQLLGITVLTSLNNNDLPDIFPSKIEFITEQWVTHLDVLATRVKLPGRVCSVNDVREMRRRQLRDATPKILVVPGISMGAAHAGQKRVGTPYTAIKDGATHIVVGSHITQHALPSEITAATEEIIAAMDA